MRLPGWIVLLLTLVVSCGSGSDSDAPATVLVFSHTTGFRHPSIEAGVEAIRDLGAANGFTVDHTEDPSFFTAENLAQYDAIVFLSTTGNPLDDASQRGALEGYIRAGGGFVGIHAASDQDATSQASWPWFGRLVGAYFGGHPLYSARPQGDESCQFGPIVSCHEGTVFIEDGAHPSTTHLARASSESPPRWRTYDEFYGFLTNPRGSVHILATLDESTYLGDPSRIPFGPGAMGTDHPIAWCHDFEGGRSFYTGLGHDTALFRNDEYLRHILGGIQWAAGVARGECA